MSGEPPDSGIEQFGVQVDVEFANPLPDRHPTDVQKLGRPGLVATGLAQHLNQTLPFLVPG